MDTVREGNRPNGESSIDIYTLPCIKLIAKRGCRQTLCDDLDVRCGGRSGDLREVIYMIYMYTYMYDDVLICIVIWQNPSQYCKATFLQLKIHFKNKI